MAGMYSDSRYRPESRRIELDYSSNATYRSNATGYGLNSDKGYGLGRDRNYGMGRERGYGMGREPRRSRSPLARGSRRDQVEIQVARRIFVNNLAYSVSWQDLKDHFRAVGEVVHADVSRERGQESRSKGWGIVEFAAPEEAAAAIQQLDRSELHGREIFLREDREDFELTGTTVRGSARGAPSSRGRGQNVAVVGRQLYVSNLSSSTTWQTLKDYFKSCGPVLHADIFEDDAGQSRGMGTVEFQYPEDALQAISRLTNTDLDGSQIRVREDREHVDTRSSRTARNATAVNGRGSGPEYAPPGTKIIVHGLPFSFAWQELKDLFKPVGGVSKADIVLDQDGRSRGWGTVTFQTPADADRAIQDMDGKEVEGRFLGVKHDKFNVPAGEKSTAGDVDMDSEACPDRSSRHRTTDLSLQGRKVVVHGLPFAYAWQDLKDLFRPVGGVATTEIVTDRNTGRSKGWGTVVFDSESDAQKAIEEMNGKEVEGRFLGVKLDARI